MTLSGNPEDKHSVSKLLKLAFGILRTVRTVSKKKSSDFDQSLSQLETSAKHIDDDYIEYRQIIGEIDRMDKDWSKGDVIK